MGAKPLRISFDKIDRFITIYEGTKYLVSFSINSIYDRIRYLISGKTSITYSISHNFATLRIDSCKSLPIGKTLTFRVIILAQLVLIGMKITTIIYF